MHSANAPSCVEWDQRYLPGNLSSVSESHGASEGEKLHPK